MARKMPRQLVALSSSAIAAIYFAGLVATRGADASIASAAALSTSPTAVVSVATAVASQPTPVVSATTTATATATAAHSSGYKDGTYSGTGTSRRGNVSVSVTVQSGRIATVTISNITTQYPVSRIASLPAQVVSRQSSQVDNVSGATYSAQAFTTAIQAALAKALARRTQYNSESGVFSARPKVLF